MANPTDLHRGDVVLVRFPNSDGTRAKYRPAVLVQDTGLVSDLPQVVLAMISSVVRSGATRVAVKMSSPAAVQMGLRTDSEIYGDVIQTVELSMIRRKLGTCPLMAEVDRAIVAALALHDALG